MLTRPARLLAALVLIASVGCSFIPAYTSPAVLRAANLFPADTWLFTDINLRPSPLQLAGATRLANAFTSQPGWDAYMRRMTSTFSEGGPQLFTDVLTQIDGEVAVGASGSLSGSADTPDFLVVAHSSNPDHLLATLASTEGLSAPRPTKDPHGANVYAEPDIGAVATLQGWLVIASDKSVLNDALTRITGSGVTSPSLADQQAFKTLVGRLPADRLALEYVDSGALYRAIGSDIPADVQVVQNVESQVAVSIAAVPAGLELRVEGTAQLPADVESAQIGDPTGAFAHMPPDTLAAFGTALPPLGSELDVALNSVLAQFDVPELEGIELHPSQWLSGPIGIGGRAPRTGQPDVFLVAQVSDAGAAQSDLATVTQAFPPKSVARVDIAGAPFNQAPISYGGSLTYGVADDWLYAVTGDAQDVVEAAGSGGLTQNPRFAAMRSALAEDMPNVFVDIQGVRDVATLMLSTAERRTYEVEVSPLLNPLTFFGGSMRSEANGDVHGHFIVGITGG